MMQRFYEHNLTEYLPDFSHSKLPRRCKTNWVEFHCICFDVFLEMYECYNIITLRML